MKYSYAPMNSTWRISWVRYGDIALGFVKFSWITRVLDVRLITCQVKVRSVKLIYCSVIGSMKGIIEIFRLEEFMCEIFIPS